MMWAESLPRAFGLQYNIADSMTSCNQVAMNSQFDQLGTECIPTVLQSAYAKSLGSKSVVHNSSSTDLSYATSTGSQILLKLQMPSISSMP